MVLKAFEDKKSIENKKQENNNEKQILSTIVYNNDENQFFTDSQENFKEVNRENINISKINKKNRSQTSINFHNQNPEFLNEEENIEENEDNLKFKSNIQKVLNQNEEDKLEDKKVEEPDLNEDYSEEEKNEEEIDSYEVDKDNFENIKAVNGSFENYDENPHQTEEFQLKNSEKENLKEKDHIKTSRNCSENNISKVDKIDSKLNESNKNGNDSENRELNEKITEENKNTENKQFNRFPMQKRNSKMKIKYQKRGKSRNNNKKIEIQDEKDEITGEINPLKDYQESKGNNEILTQIVGETNIFYQPTIEKEIEKEILEDIFDKNYIMEKNQEKYNINRDNKFLEKLDYEVMKMHPRLISKKQSLIPFPICETNVGCSGCCKIYEESNLDVTGLGIIMYLKILKTLSIVFLIICLLNGLLYWVYISSHAETPMTSYLDYFFKTTIGNIGASK